MARTYTIEQLSSAIRDLRRRTPQSDCLPQPEDQTGLRAQWLRWLDEYLEPGYYDRKNAHDDAQWAYNHLNNGRMIVWLNEAAGESPRIIGAAIAAMEDREPPQTEAKYARRVLPWEELARRLFE